MRSAPNPPRGSRDKVASPSWPTERGELRGGPCSRGPGRAHTKGAEGAPRVAAVREAEGELRARLWETRGLPYARHSSVRCARLRAPL